MYNPPAGADARYGRHGPVTGGGTMGTGDFYERVSSVRQSALELLNDSCDRGGEGGGMAPMDADVVVALQRSANELGVAQAALAAALSAVPEPARIEVGPAPVETTMPLTAEAAIVLALAETTIP